MMQPVTPSSGKRFPPQQVRITSLKIEPNPDGVRVRVLLTLTPFQERPGVELRIIDAAEKEAANVSIIEAMDHRMALTMHLRGGGFQPPFRLTVRVIYPESEPADQKNIEFNFPAEPPPES